MALPGFQLLQADRTKESGKKKGGVMSVFVKNRGFKVIDDVNH